jgi:large subunit ribosomal protein L29
VQRRNCRSKPALFLEMRRSDMARELTELREMDLATLVEELRATKQEALNLRFRNATGQLDDTAAITKARRQIARISMLIREREIVAAEAAGK